LTITCTSVKTLAETFRYLRKIVKINYNHLTQGDNVSVIEDLDLSKNELESIPEEFEKLCNLKILKINCNHVTNPNNNVSVFWKLNNHQEIDIRYNRLDSK